MGDGKFASTLPLFGGMTIWEASKPICNALREAGALFEVKMFDHSYMHCWRHKTPIIYRATSQWFAGMDVTPKDGGATLRETALKGIADTEFFPDWGQARLHGMIANRPDWTLSRQRQWGVPMAFFVHKETGELHPRTPELLEQVAKLIEKDGIEAWQALDLKDLIGDEAAIYAKNKDTLDVWFDSGATHQTVLRGSQARIAVDAAAIPGRPVPGRLGPASRLVPLVAAGVVDAERPSAVQSPADARLHGRRRRQEDVQVAGQHAGAAKDLGHPGRRHPAPVGRLDRLHGRAVDLRRNPETRDGSVSPHPQHPALPAGQYRRTSIRPRTPCRWRRCSKSTAMRWPTWPRCRTQIENNYARYEFHPVVLASCRPTARKTWAASTSTS